MPNDTWRTDPKVLEADFTELLQHAGVEWWETTGRALSNDIAVEEMRDRGVPFLDTTTTEPDTDGPDTDGLRQWWIPFDQFEQPTEPPVPFFTRDDERPLLYWRALSWIYGSPGSGKSWAALMAAKEALHRDYNVAFIDYEDTASAFKERALVLGLYDHLATGHLRYVPGHDLELGHRAEIAEWAAGDDGEGLVIIDSAGSSGAPDDGPAGLPEWLAEHIRPFTLLPDSKRPALLVVDHIPKNRGRAAGPIGAQAKLRAVTGIAMRTTGRPWTRSESGSITLHCEKDRRGYWQRGTPMATIVGGWQDGTFGWQVTEPTENEISPPTSVSEVEDAIAQVLEAHPQGISYTKMRDPVREIVHAQYSTIRNVLTQLVKEEIVHEDKTRNYAVYQFPLSPPLP